LAYAASAKARQPVDGARHQMEAIEFEHRMSKGVVVVPSATGKRVDLITVPGNPLVEIRVIEDVRFVMKQGVVYKQH
jgi:hypothetical protein